MKISDADLTAESLKAASYYLKTTQQEALPAPERSRVANSVAHGFFMGVRWIEEKQQGEASNGDINTPA